MVNFHNAHPMLFSDPTQQLRTWQVPTISTQLSVTTVHYLHMLDSILQAGANLGGSEDVETSFVRAKTTISFTIGMEPSFHKKEF